MKRLVRTWDETPGRESFTPELADELRDAPAEPEKKGVQTFSVLAGTATLGQWYIHDDVGNRIIALCANEQEARRVVAALNAAKEGTA